MKIVEITAEQKKEQELTTKMHQVPFDSKEYWQLRAVYCEMLHDPTYTKSAREFSFKMHRILQNRSR